MQKKYDFLFNNLGFKEKRNDIFKQFIDEIEKYSEKKGLDSNTNFSTKCKNYFDKNSSITFNNFTFKMDTGSLIFYHQYARSSDYEISNLKLFKIFKGKSSNKYEEEYIFNKDYLRYLIFNIYQMKNPKFAHSTKSLNDEDSSCSLTEETDVIDYLYNDWEVIYEEDSDLDFYNEMNNIKNLILEERIKNDFFNELIGLKGTKVIPVDYKIYSSSLDELFSSFKSINKKTIIFHNEDNYFTLTLFKKFEDYYKWGDAGFLYINFDLFKNVRRPERAKKFIYLLLYLFPISYDDFKLFYENNMKYLISDNIDCWTTIIDKIINYFQNNIFKEKEEEESKIETGKKEKEIQSIEEAKKLQLQKFNLFLNPSKKKFFIIFDNISTFNENVLVKSIINSYSLTNFSFIVIYPLINNFTFEKLIDITVDSPRKYDDFSLYFANIKDNKINPKYKEKVQEKALSKEKIEQENIIYDFIRIFKFKSIFVDSIYSEINSKSLIYLKHYIEYINIHFDNKNKKIIDISFKNEIVEKEFIGIYGYILDLITKKNNILFNNINGQKDGFDIESIIISTLITNKYKSYENLKVKSIFGLKDLQKEENIDYESKSFFLTQNSSCAEVFDFGIKIVTKEFKQYLKIIQSTLIKNKEEQYKICIERILIYCSYLKKQFEENKLGKLDGISFIIISPIKILENNKSYKSLKKFCKQNGYEFILFNVNERAFYKRKNWKNEIYNIDDLFNVNNEYLLELKDFNQIIKIDKPLRMISPRKVRARDEEEEDENAQKKGNDYFKQKIKRVAKFEYEGKITDIKEINENYFAYIYSKDKKSYYFYKNNILKEKEEDEMEIENKTKRQKNTKFILILYSEEKIFDKYEDSSEEILKKKEKKKKREKSCSPSQMIELDENEEQNPNNENEDLKIEGESNKKKQGKRIIKNLLNIKTKHPK